METVGHVAIMVIIGYLLGSIPFARLFTMRLGVDLFETGTGNPGAANVFRKVDKKIGIAVFIADFLKGAIPVLVAWAIGSPREIWVVAGGAAIVGHWYPIFNGFRGGAGLATGSGVVLALIPVPGVIGVAVGAIAISKLKSSGHAALLGVIIILAVAAAFQSEWPLGAEWPAVASAIVISIVLFAKALARGWKPGRKE